MNCNDKKKFRTSEASSKASLRTKGAIDKFLNILDTNLFRKYNKQWSQDARERFNISGSLFYEENNKVIPNKEAFQKIDSAKKQYSGTQYQLESKLINPAIEELDNFLLDFLRNFNVKSKQFDELKSRLGVNALGATDVLNKLIWYVKNRNEETLPEESAHMLVALMGENHPDIKELLINITNWSEYNDIKNQYLPIYKDENKVKIEAVGKLIAKSLVKNYKANGLDKNKLQKTLENILNFIENILNSLNISDAFFYNENIADHIAVNILSGNKDYIYKIKNFNPNLNAKKEINNNPHAKKIISTFSSSSVKMTGSLAIAGTENIRRPKGQGIHDIDFKVKSFEVFNKEILLKIPENAVSAHFGWHKRDYSTFAYLIPMEGYKIEVLERKDDFSNGLITNYKLYNEKNEQVEITQQNVIAVDFFVYKEGVSPKDFDFSSDFIPASLVYKGKMSLSGRSNPYFFSRDKDQEDYVLRNPKSFIPFEKHIYYQLDNNSQESLGDIKKQILEEEEKFKKEDVYFNLNSSPEIQFDFKISNIISGNLAKIRQWESNKSVSQEILYNKIQQLGVPKEQLELLKNSDGNTIEEKLTNLIANYSYTVEINTATQSTFESNSKNWANNNFAEIEGIKYINHYSKGWVRDKSNIEVTEEERREINKLQNPSENPTQHYSNLTVPGGTNGSYKEQNFETPLIKVPKSHARFNTENTIGFSRNDDRQTYTEKDIDSLLEIMKKSGILEVKC